MTDIHRRSPCIMLSLHCLAQIKFDSHMSTPTPRQSQCKSILWFSSNLKTCHVLTSASTRPDLLYVHYFGDMQLSALTDIIKKKKVLARDPSTRLLDFISSVWSLVTIVCASIALYSFFSGEPLLLSGFRKSPLHSALTEILPNLEVMHVCNNLVLILNRPITLQYNR